VAAEGELLLGIDIGTSSSKGCLVRPDGELVATAQRPHEVSRPHPGWVEQDADVVWWGDVKALCRELLPHAEGAPLHGVCVSGLGPCVVAADRSGEPLRPAILYGVDSRATDEIAELTERFGADEILRRCGSPLSTQAVGPKLLWLRHREPEVWERTERFFTASSFLVDRLTGEYVLDHHSASQSDPLYELDSNAWIPEWAEEIAPGLELPRLLWPWELAGEVTGAAAEATGIPAGTPVAAGTIDTWAEAASVGARNAGDMMVMYGTTMFLVQVLTEASPHPRLWSTASLEPGAHNVAGGMATSGALAAWVSELTGSLSHEQLGEEAGAVAPGADGLVVLPYFAGERSPLFDPRARHDLRPDARPRPGAPLPRDARGERLRRAPHPRGDGRGGRPRASRSGGRRRHARRPLDADRLRRDGHPEAGRPPRHDRGKLRRRPLRRARDGPRRGRHDLEPRR